MPEQSPECLAEITLRTERVYDGRAVSLRVDAVRLPDGSEAKREVVEHPGAVALVALSDHGEVLLVRQWRHAAGQALLEIPAGTLEPGEAPIDCAGRDEEGGNHADLLAGDGRHQRVVAGGCGIDHGEFWRNDRSACRHLA